MMVYVKRGSLEQQDVDVCSCMHVTEKSGESGGNKRAPGVNEYIWNLICRRTHTKPTYNRLNLGADNLIVHSQKSKQNAINVSYVARSKGHSGHDKTSRFYLQDCYQSAADS